MAAGLSAPPVLSTPDDHILDGPAPSEPVSSSAPDDALASVYEIDRTVSELRAGSWRRIALQFPDDMLPDAPRVAELLRSSLSRDDGNDGVSSDPRVYILGDTSYSACCVDEVGAEHADADVVVHYGRACLSPTSRLPVIYVYTSRPLDRDAAARCFETEFSDRQARVVVMADLMYQHHVGPLVERLAAMGYANVLATEVVRDPAGLLPNRRILGAPLEVDEGTLRDHALFHISDPPASVLLALHSRFSSLHVLDTSSSSSSTTTTTTTTNATKDSAPPPRLENPTARTAGMLRRRFARVLTLASAGVVGILVNTLSVAGSLSSVDALRRACAAAGKKTYTVVVGRLNPAKLANFAEVEGWVVVGCWEGGLVGEQQGTEGYWRPVVTPYEMSVALTREEERVWGGEWWGGIERLKLDDAPRADRVEDEGRIEVREDEDCQDGIDGDESLPPEFDLRTGRLVSHSRPMHKAAAAAARSSKSGRGSSGDSGDRASEALVRRNAAGEVASINGVASPGAEFLRSQRTWQGLGSDFAESHEASTVVEEGRSGIARGYRVGEDGDKH